MHYDIVLVSAQDVIDAMPDVTRALAASVAQASIGVQITFSINKNPAVIVAELMESGDYKLTPALVMFDTPSQRDTIIVDWAPRQWLNISAEELTALMLMTPYVRMGPLPRMPDAYPSLS